MRGGVFIGSLMNLISKGHFAMAVAAVSVTPIPPSSFTSLSFSHQRQWPRLTRWQTPARDYSGFVTHE